MISAHLSELCAQAALRFGAVSQIRQVGEECCELGAECMRVHRGRTDRMNAMYSEAADVAIMLEQLRHLDPERFAAALASKTEHLERLLSVRDRNATPSISEVIARAKDTLAITTRYGRKPSESTLLLAHNDLAALISAVESLQTLCDILRQEAKIHAQEARSQKATVHEIYQIISGGKGEPGDWSGARPVREFVQAKEEQLAAAERTISRVQADRDALLREKAGLSA